MPFTKNFEFPSDEELKIDDVNLSHPYLKAGALQLGKYCEKENNEFMLCKKEIKDPRQCLKQGKAVTNCTMKYFCNIKKHCAKELEQFALCLHKTETLEYKECRKTQAIFDKCVLDKMGVEKPPFGWHAEVHIHHTDRPKPKEELSHYPNPAAKLPYDEIKLEEPKYGRRTNIPRF